MNKNNIIQLLSKYNSDHVNIFVGYCSNLAEKVKDNKKVNPWMFYRSDEFLAECFIKVHADGLVFDGVNIILLVTGISYNHVAYKNKMLLAYPESKIDISLVYKDDEFTFSKSSGEVRYSHKIKNPFGHIDTDIIGGYCIIKNKRGEFLTLLSSAEIGKHRKVAKSDNIWLKWFSEMCMKTITKKACIRHFKDLFTAIEKNDNENCNLDNPMDLEPKYKSEIDAIETVEEMTTYWHENKGRGAPLQAYMTTRKEEITTQQLIK